MSTHVLWRLLYSVVVTEAADMNELKTLSDVHAAGAGNTPAGALQRALGAGKSFGVAQVTEARARASLESLIAEARANGHAAQVAVGQQLLGQISPDFLSNNENSLNVAAIVVRDILRQSQFAHLNGGEERAIRGRWYAYAGVDIGAAVNGLFTSSTLAQIQGYKGPALEGMVKGVVAAYNSHNVMRAADPISDSNFPDAYIHSMNGMWVVYGQWLRPGEVDPTPSPAIPNPYRLEGR